MTPKTEAQAHLGKAGEFLDAAELAAASSMWNAAASAAVTSDHHGPPRAGLLRLGVSASAGLTADY